MGRDSRGRAQEAQWKLMLQGTKVRHILTHFHATGADRALPSACVKSFTCTGACAQFYYHPCSMLIAYQSVWSPSSAMCQRRQ